MNVIRKYFFYEKCSLRKLPRQKDPSSSSIVAGIDRPRDGISAIKTCFKHFSGLQLGGRR